MSIFIFALASIPITATILGFFTLFLLATIEKRIQWGKKSSNEWQQLGVENPGERLPLISIIFSTIDNTVTKTFALLVAQFIFHYFTTQMPVSFIILCGLIFIIHDGARIKRFIGSHGIWTEIGYLLGDLISLIIALIIFV